MSIMKAVGTDMVTWCEMHFAGIQNPQAVALQESHTIVNWGEMRIVKCQRRRDAA